MTTPKTPRTARRRVPGLALVMLGFAGFLGLEWLLDGDLWLARQMHDTQRGWYLGYLAPWCWLNDYGEYPAVVVASVALLGWIASWIRRDPRPRTACLAILIALLLGPGIAVKALRDFWGRPRPRELVSMGGVDEYRSWWQPRGPFQGKSFPSGHVSMGVVLAILGFLPGTRERPGLRLTLITAALSFGALLAVARLLRGAHFATDAAWAILLTWLSVLATRRLILDSARLE